MRRAKYNPIWTLFWVFVLGACTSALVITTVMPTEGDIEPIELEPPETFTEYWEERARVEAIIQCFRDHPSNPDRVWDEELEVYLPINTDWEDCM